MILSQSQRFASPEEALAHISEMPWRDYTKKPGSPSDILKHHGVKGMRWGVRKQEETSDRASATKKEPLERTSGGRVQSLSERTSSGKAQPVSSGTSALTEKQQLRVEKFQGRADFMDTKISELRAQNEKLEKSNTNPAKLYTQYVNNQTIKDLERAQTRALRDVEAVQKGKLTTGQKQAIIGGVAVVGLIAAGYGATKLVEGQQSGAINSAMLRGRAAIQGKKSPFAVNKDLAAKMSFDDLLNNVVKPVNPGYSSMGGKMNCRRATYAYELRRRGFDVSATTSAIGWGQSESGVINAVTPGSRNFYNAMSMSQAVVSTGGSTVAPGDIRTNPIPKILLDKLNTGGPDGETAAYGSKKVFEALGKQPNGSRGEVLFKFPGFGHSMAYEVVNGKPHVFDSQKGTYHDLTKTVEEKWGSFNGAEITRLDNVDLDINFLTRWATNRS